MRKTLRVAWATWLRKRAERKLDVAQRNLDKAKEFRARAQRLDPLPFPGRRSFKIIDGKTAAAMKIPLSEDPWAVVVPR